MHFSGVRVSSLCVVLVSHSQTAPSPYKAARHGPVSWCRATVTVDLQLLGQLDRIGNSLGRRTAILTAAAALPGWWLTLVPAQGSGAFGLCDHVSSPSSPTFLSSPHTALPRSWFETQVLGEMLDNIELNVMHTVDHVEKARDETKKAVKYQGQARKKLIIIIVVVVVLLGILALIIGLSVGLK